MQSKLAIPIKLLGVPERCSFKGWVDFVKGLPSMLAGEIPSSLIGVVVSKNAPSEDDRERVWYRVDSSGNYVGIYGFQAGSWQRLYDFAPGQVIWVTGDSANLPPGFTLISTGLVNLPSQTIDGLMAQYIPNLTGGYGYFAMLFTGYV